MKLESIWIVFCSYKKFAAILYSYTFSILCLDSCVLLQLWKCLSELTGVWKLPVFILTWSLLGVLTDHISLYFLTDVEKVASHLLKEMPALLLYRNYVKCLQERNRYWVHLICFYKEQRNPDNLWDTKRVFLKHLFSVLCVFPFLKCICQKFYLCITFIEVS